MTTMTEKAAAENPPRRGHNMSPEWEKAFEKVWKDHEEAFRKLAKL